MSDGQVVFSTRLDESGVRNGLSNLKTGISGLGSGIGAALGTLGAGLAAGVLSGAKAMVDNAISSASRLREVQNVVDVTFGESAARVNEWAKAAKEAYGMGELRAKQYASTMGAMFKSMGFATDEALDMSTAMAGLAGDMASFYNLDYDTAFDKLRSGISGETEPLKQLGINLSVANIEAFALSKGVTRAYEKMAPAEQAMWRYNYILSATSAAQGDFARTSDGYANQQRILQTTQEELAATIGEVLLPIAIDATKVMNELVSGLGDAVKWFDNLFSPPHGTLDQQIADAVKAVDDFSGAIKGTGKNLDTSLAAAKATQATAVSLLKNYEEIQSKDVLTAADTAQLQSIAKQIVSLYPDMGAAIDATTGLFNTNTSAVRANIDALAANKESMAYYTATQGYREELVKAGVVMQQAFTAYDTKYQDWMAKRADYAALKTVYDSISNDAATIEAHAGTLKMLTGSLDGYFEVAADGGYKLSAAGKAAYKDGTLLRDVIDVLNPRLGVLATNEAAASRETNNLYEKWNESIEAHATAQGNMDAASESAQKLAGSYGYAAIEGQRLTAATGSLAGGVTRVVNGTKAETAETIKLREALTQLSEDTLKQIDAQINGFERIKKVRPKSAKQSTAALNSQTNFMRDFAKNWKIAKEKGVDQQSLVELSELTAENAAMLAGLAIAKDSEIAGWNAAYAARSAERETFTASMVQDIASLTDANAKLTAIAAPAVVDAAGTVSDGVGKAAASGKKSAAALEDTATAAAQTVVQISTLAEDNAGTLETAGGDMIESVAGGMQKNASVKAALAKKIAEAVVNARSYGITNGYSIGSNMVGGVVQGIDENGYKIKNALLSAIRTALDAIKIWALINSPSKRFANELGSPFAEGVGYGFDKMMGPVSASMIKSIAASVQAGQAVLNNTLLGKTLQGSGLSYPSVSNLSMGAMAGSALSSVYGGQPAGAVTNVEYTQNVTFAQPMQAPDEVARAIRKINTYGLAGARG